MSFYKFSSNYKSNYQETLFRIKLNIFSFLIATYIISVFGYISTYPDTAKSLQLRIRWVLQNFEKMHTNVQKAYDKIDFTTFNSTNYRMDILKKAMQAKSTKKGYSECEKLFNITKVAYSNHLQSYAAKGLFDTLVTLRKQNESLLQIQGRLSGPALVAEINACQEPIKKCNLTGIYNSTIVASENYQRANFKLFTSDDLVHRILAKVMTNKEMIRSLNDIIINTVNQCLNRLK